MENLSQQVYRLREEVLSLAQACLSADELEVFQELNRVVVDLTQIAQRFSTNDTTINGQVTSEDRTVRASILAGPIRIFKVYKGQRYEAALDPRHIQLHGRGKCILLNGIWYSASRSVRVITETQVNGWTSFWRYADNQGIERPIDDLRKAVQRAQ